MSLTTTTTQLPAEIADVAARYAAQASSPATARAYTADWADFSRWCADHGQTALPALPATIGGYLAVQAQSGLSVATVERRLAAITMAHRQSGHGCDTKHPGIALVMSGVRRQHGVKPQQVTAAVADDVRAMALTCDGSLRGLRDRALLLLGFAIAARRSELVAIQVSDLVFSAAGMVVTIRRSKTDQDGHGAEVGVASPAVIAAVQAWLAAAGITDGALLRSVDRHGNLGADMSDRAVALVIKARAEACGLDAAVYSGHSLRAGLVTTMAVAGCSDSEIMEVSRHTSSEVMRAYIRKATVLSSPALAKIGL